MNKVRKVYEKVGGQSIRFRNRSRIAVTVAVTVTVTTVTELSMLPCKTKEVKIERIVEEEKRLIIYSCRTKI